MVVKNPIGDSTAETCCHNRAISQAAETTGLLSHLGRPECVWLLELCPESVATKTDPLQAATGGGNGSHLVC